MTATAPSATNVHVDTALPTGKRKSAIANTDYQVLDDNWVSVSSVQLFREGKYPDRVSPFDDCTGSFFDTIFNSTKTAEGEGVFAQLIDDHTNDDDSDANKEVVGHVRNMQMRGENGNRVIFGDLIIKKDFFDSCMVTNLRPRRSVEISRPSFRIGQVALMGIFAPASLVRDIYFTQKQNEFFSINESMTFKGSFMDAPENTNQTPPAPQIQQQQDGGQEKLNKLAEIMNSLSEQEWTTLKAMCKYTQETDIPEGSDKTKDLQASDKIKESFSALQKEYEAMKIKNSQLEARSVALEEASIATEVEREMFKLKSNDGVIMGTNDQEENIKKSLCSIKDAKTRAEKYAEMKNFWAKAPVGKRVNMEGVISSTDDEPSITFSDKQANAKHKRAIEYSNKFGVSITEAYKHVV